MSQRDITDHDLCVVIHQPHSQLTREMVQYINCTMATLVERVMVDNRCHMVNGASVYYVYLEQ